MLKFNLPARVAVTDPCYDDASVKILHAEPGVWIGDVVKKNEGSWGVRVAELIARREGAPANLPWELLERDTPVDSGQMGIFDLDAYENSDRAEGDYDDHQSFYGEACAQTLGEQSWGLTKKIAGVVSSSGYGDGGYKTFVQWAGGKVVGIRVVFISDDEDDDYDTEADYAA